MAGFDIVAYAAAKKFTEETADTLGSLKGAPATIKSITDIEGGHRVTFAWTGASGTEQAQTMDVMDGAQGPQGEKGADGTNGVKGDKGDDGFSPVITIVPITGGHRVTVTDAEGSESFDVMDGQGGSGSGDAVLTSALTTSKAVGGIPIGKTYAANTPLESIFKDMLNPVEVPTFTSPSATISTSGGTLVEEGESVSKTLTVNFDRGKINPAYGTTGNRAGAATGYSLNGGESQSGNTFNVTVNEDNKQFSAKVDYARGEQPKNSAGEDYDSPLPAGFVNTNTLTFEIVAPLWSNAANITVIAKEALVSKSAKLKQFNFPAQTATNPEVFDVRSTWNVTAVELLNTLNNQWVNCASEFTITDTEHDGIAYKRYTYNGGDATGARSVRIKWS